MRRLRDFNMSSQLITLQTKGTWTCPLCGIVIRLSQPGGTIRCACGHVENLNGPEAKISEPSSQAERRHRLQACKHCDKQFGSHRCSLIDLGCRDTFDAVLSAQAGECPLGKWREPSPVVRIHVFPSVHILNLLYHVYPSKKNDVWRANVRQVVRRIKVFSGRKVVAVATAPDLHGIDVVRSEFGEQGIEYLEIPNDTQLREVATFLPLLELVASDDPEEASFYAHTKGNATADNALGAEMWRNQAYHSLLDGVNACRDLLQTHAAVGTHKMVWPDGMSPYPSGLNHGNWMLAGTFFWFRHRDVFTHPAWRDIPRDRYGAEAWLSGLFAPERAATMFQPWPVNEYPTPSPYDPALYLWPIRDT